MKEYSIRKNEYLCLCLNNNIKLIRNSNIFAATEMKNSFQLNKSKQRKYLYTREKLLKKKREEKN